MFTGAFTKTNESDEGYNFFYLTDDSVNEGETITDRYFYIIKADGSYVQTADGDDMWDFNPTDYPSGIIDVQVLTEDVAVTIDMFWTSSSPQGGSTYEVSTPFDFLDYANDFKFSNTIIAMANYNNLVDNKNFLDTIKIYQTALAGSALMIEAVDPGASQTLIDEMVNIQNNPNLLY